MLHCRPPAPPAKLHRLDCHGYFSRSTKCQRAWIQFYLTLLDRRHCAPNRGTLSPRVITLHDLAHSLPLPMAKSPSPWEILGGLAIAAHAQLTCRLETAASCSFVHCVQLCRRLVESPNLLLSPAPGHQSGKITAATVGIACTRIFSRVPQPALSQISQPTF